jgi:hypothetical protein
MKKIFLVLGVCGAMAATLSSCNNAAETEKLTNEQNAKLQSLVDEKLTALEAEVAAECDAEVLTVATAQFDSLVAVATAAASKGGKKPAAKPAPKPVVAKKEEPKDPQKERGGGAKTVEEIQKQRNSDPAKTDVENQKKRN